MNILFHFRELARAAPRGAASHGADRRRVGRAAVVLSLWLVLAPTTGAAAGAENESALSRFGWGLGAGLCTLVYTPVKVAYAAGAIPLGGLVWIFSVGDAKIAASVITRATAGDFVVTPEHLKRERPLVFIGPRKEQGLPKDDGAQGG